MIEGIALTKPDIAGLAAWTARSRDMLYQLLDYRLGARASEMLPDEVEHAIVDAIDKSVCCLGYRLIAARH